MLARKELLTTFEGWNHKHRAPNGRTSRISRLAKLALPEPLRLRVAGEFSVQPNNTTRAFEYPWAFHAASVRPGMKVLEIGGGLSGFQFVLDRAGCDVVNVDPGLEARGKGWPCDQVSMRKMNVAFGTNVLLRNCTIDRASLEPASFDRAFSISVLEHLPEDERDRVMRSVFDCLRPNGLFILTVDLFLNLTPFTGREENEYGCNVNIRALCRKAPFEKVLGDSAQLFGFPEFDPNGIQARLEEYVVGQYPALVQCLILRKPGLDVERLMSVPKVYREEITT